MREALPLKQVLDYYGIQYRDISGEQAIRCPAGTHDDRVPSCSLNISRGLWHCHSCGAKGSAIDLIMANEGIDAKTAVEEYARRFGDADGSLRKPARGQSRIGVFEFEGPNGGSRTTASRLGGRADPWG